MTPDYFRGLRHGLTLAHPTGPSPFQVLDAAMRWAQPWERQAVLGGWRTEYPLVNLTKRQRASLGDWAVVWEKAAP